MWSARQLATQRTVIFDGIDVALALIQLVVKMGSGRATSVANGANL